VDYGPLHVRWLDTLQGKQSLTTPAPGLKVLASGRVQAGSLRDAAREPHKVCAGNVTLQGYGPVAIINAAWNKRGQKAGPVRVLDDSVRPTMRSRTYFGAACAEGSYQRQEYLPLNLFGKTLRYTVDLSGAGCGCNAALYLVALPRSTSASECSDYYCDAAKVCGVSCAEIDIQEANQFAFVTTVHTHDDPAGLGAGYGANRRTWNDTVYGPGAACIDTRLPFQVEAAFPVNEMLGSLTSMEVTLFQARQRESNCSLSTRTDDYRPGGRDGLVELAASLKAGMTPVISYWGAGENMQWMDGLGQDGRGPCKVDHPSSCPSSVTFADFVVSSV